MILSMLRAGRFLVANAVHGDERCFYVDLGHFKEADLALASFLSGDCETILVDAAAPCDPGSRTGLRRRGLAPSIPEEAVRITTGFDASIRWAKDAGANPPNTTA